MTEVVVPTAPALARIADVELMQTGTWWISTGEFTFTYEDFVSAVAALDCPAVRRPILKLGHTDPRFDGEPAVGYIDNMAVADNGRTLVGDYAGMPGWLGQVIASAYPDRSIEGQYDFRCQMAHTHPFVVTAVALLGVTAPGIGSLESLQDVAQLYGVDVAAAAANTTGVPVAVTASRRDEPMPNPQPRQIAASVTSEDVSRAFYSSPIGDSWDSWIEELQLDPLQIIYVDDRSGDRFRVAVTIGAGDGVDAVAFAEPVKVVIRYDDAAVAAAAGKASIRFASKAESRPDAPKSPAATADGPSNPEGGSAVAFSDEQITDIRQRLGVSDDADETAILAALAEALAERADPPPAPAPTPTAPVLPDGVVVIDQEQLAELQVAAKAGVAASQRFADQDRDTAIKAAISEGRIPKARQEHYEKAWAADAEGTKTLLASLAKGLVPVEQIGTAHNAEADGSDPELDSISAAVTRTPLKQVS